MPENTFGINRPSILKQQTVKNFKTRMVDLYFYNILWISIKTYKTYMFW